MKYESECYPVSAYDFKGDQKARFLVRCPEATHILVDYSGARNRVRKASLADNGLELVAIIGGTTNRHTVAGCILREA